jgi:hypothetical protein
MKEGSVFVLYVLLHSDLPNKGHQLAAAVAFLVLLESP